VTPTKSLAMKSLAMVIPNRLGLHARAAAKLVQLANQFTARITVEKEGELADAKSIMEVLMLAAAKDSRVVITAEGKDEDVALEEIRRLIENKFGEED
jgi:phosphocarrier protein HPr